MTSIEPSNPTATKESSTSIVGTHHRRDSRARATRRALDAVAVVVLIGAAVVARRHVLPSDGLWGDDAWPALGAANGLLSNFLTVGFSHPGFTATLMVWIKLVDTPEHLADLAFAAGVLSPALLYLALRRFGYAQSISLLLGAALVAIDLHVIYSGRVKTYVFDALIVLGLAVLVPRLARARWNWRVAVLWVGGSMIIGAFSPFALIATAVAGAMFLLRPAGDFMMRTIAVGVQVASYLALALATLQTYDSRLLVN